jgi:beta-galactosidase
MTALFTPSTRSHQNPYVLDLREIGAQGAAGAEQDPLPAISPHGETIALHPHYLIRNGRPSIPIMGEFHPSRFPRQYWREELQKMQAGGIEIVSSYVFWIHVEEEEGVFDWSDDRDLRTFVKTCGTLGLEVLLRIGPFAHGECRNGGLPDWLYGRAIAVRSNDERYLFYVRRFFREIAQQVEGLLFKDGGPIIGIQVENEYMHAGAPWEVPFRRGAAWVPAGSDGSSHLILLKELALEVGLEVPIYTCTAWGGAAVPAEGFLPMHAAYAFTPWVMDPQFEQRPTREFLFRRLQEAAWAQQELTYDVSRYPYAYCEMGTGIQITYHHRPLVPAECTQALLVVALGSGCNWPGYYMYHGGSNPVGKHGYLNEYSVPRISYDFQAPLGEYGQVKRSYHRLRQLHLFLQAFGEHLAPMPVALPLAARTLQPEQTQILRYAARSRDGAGFLFLNNYQDHAETEDLSDITFQLILPQETLTLPRRGGLTLCRHVSAILPFNLALEGGVLLKYATAQPLTVLRNEHETTYIFFAPPGLPAEFALARTTPLALRITGGTLDEDGPYLYAQLQAGPAACLEMTTAHGRALRLLVLTQEQADAAWKVHLQGCDYLILFEGLVLTEQETLHLSWRERETLDLLTYPPLPTGTRPSTASWEQVSSALFAHYRLEVPACTPELHLEQPTPETLRVRIASEALGPLHEAFLRVDCLADVGEVYLDGRLVADHFFNGQPWEIGLKRFLHAGADLELVLRFSPLAADASVRRYFPAEALSAGAAGVSLRSIAILPEYRATLSMETSPGLAGS